MKRENPIHKTENRVQARLIDSREFAMGSPFICTYLLPDGSVIPEGGAATCFTPDQRYFITSRPSQKDWLLQIYDTKEKIIYTCNPKFRVWEFHEVTDSFFTVRCLPVSSREIAKFHIQSLIEMSEPSHMVEISDIKIPKSLWDAFEIYRVKKFPKPDLVNSPNIWWEFFLPNSLINLENPLNPITNPKAEIIVSDKKSGLLVSMINDKIVWGNSGLSFTCTATPIDSMLSENWQWDTKHGWQKIM